MKLDRAAMRVNIAPELPWRGLGALVPADSSTTRRRLSLGILAEPKRGCGASSGEHVVACAAMSELVRDCFASGSATELGSGRMLEEPNE